MIIFITAATPAEAPGKQVKIKQGRGIVGGRAFSQENIVHAGWMPVSLGDELSNMPAAA
jgi:hypothetical protein